MTNWVKLIADPLSALSLNTPDSSQTSQVLSTKGVGQPRQTVRERDQDINPWSTVYPRVVKSQRGVQLYFDESMIE